MTGPENLSHLRHASFLSQTLRVPAVPAWTICKMSTAPKISLAAITNNAVEYTERFIRSFAPAVDEIVLVRAIGNLTPDATLEIAGKVCAELGKKLITGEYRN